MAGYKKLSAVVDTVGEDNQASSVTAGNPFLKLADEIRKSDFSFHEFQSKNELSKQAARFGESIIRGTSTEERSFVIKKSPQLCVELFVSLLSNFKSRTKLQYIVTLLADCTEIHDTTVIIARTDEKQELIHLLLSLLGRQDNYSQATACVCFSKLVVASSTILKPDVVNQYLSWTLPQMKHTQEYLHCITKSVMSFLKKCEYRSTFYDNGGLKPILDLIDRKLNFQFQYELIFIVWMLSFESKLVNCMKEYPVAVVLCDVLKTTNRPKVQRVILATFRNLIEKAEPDIAEKYSAEMIHFKAIPVLNVLESKQLEDLDFESDVTYLQERLKMSLQDLSSFDEYATEVTSGRLEWSPVHKSDKFWRENVMKLNEKNYDLLRMLVAILTESQSLTAIAVAAHDLGEYVRYYPRGKRVIDRLGAKETVMKLVNHDNTEVRMQALLSIQKMMVQNWEYLGKQLESKA